MSPAGYSGTPLVRKLGIKAGAQVGWLHAPEHLADLLEDLPAGVRMGELDPDAEPCDVILLFAADQATLDDEIERAVAALQQNGGLWLIWPKKSSSMKTNLTQNAVRAAGLSTGLVDNKVCAVDEDWSGLRFVVRTRDRTR